MRGLAGILPLEQEKKSGVIIAPKRGDITISDKHTHFDNVEKILEASILKGIEPGTFFLDANHDRYVYLGALPINEKEGVVHCYGYYYRGKINLTSFENDLMYDKRIAKTVFKWLNTVTLLKADK